MVFVATPIAGLACCVLFHILLSRTWPGLSRATSVAASVLSGALAAMGICVVFAEVSTEAAVDEVGYSAAWLLSYVSLAYCYVFAFFNLGESARRIRLLIELDDVRDRGLTLENILRAYNARMIIRARLDRLLAAGQIVERRGRYFVGSPMMLRVAKGLVLMKVLFLGSSSEFGSRSVSAHQPS